MGGDVGGDAQKNVHLARTRRNAVPQCHAVQKLHGDERFAVLVVNFIDRADIRVIESRGGLGFALKSAEGLRVFGYVVGEELESHKAIEFYILSLVDHAHAAAAEFLDNAVVRDDLADHQKMLGFRVASSYGRGIRESTKGGCGTSMSDLEHLPCAGLAVPRLFCRARHMTPCARKLATAKKYRKDGGRRG